MKVQDNKSTQELEKEARVQKMFSAISGRYDLLNRVMSGRQDVAWRTFAVEQCCLQPGDRAVDVCAGTGDIAIDLIKVVGAKGRVVGVDFCLEMMEIGAEKIKQRNLDSQIEFVQANAESMPFPDDTFAAATNGFALRNVASIERTLREMRRVIKPGGRVVVLELAKPQLPIIRSLYEPYFYRVVPIIGGLISGNRGAYKYLPNSLTLLPGRKEILETFGKIGLKSARCYDLTLGVATVFVGIK